MFRYAAWIAVRSFYRVVVSGHPPPLRGAALLLANHPNSLFDPALVLASSSRRIRFLAKAPLFEDPRVAWVVKLAGAIPVYRRSDDPSAMSGNDAMFSAVDEALESGSAIGLFPEGRSHSEPSMGELRTGAARMALSAAGRLEGPFPIVPVGLLFRSKEVFRSDAAVIFGEPVEWEDLSARGAGDREAVRKLTERIEASLKDVTVNLERWEDKPLLEGAVEVWSTERELAEGGSAGAQGSEPKATDPSESERVQRLRVASELLAESRATGDPRSQELIAALARHLERLSRVGLTPRSLWSRTRARVAAGWVSKRLYLLGLPMLFAAALGWVVFRVPNVLTGVVARRTAPSTTEVATHKLVAGAVLNALWLLLLSAAVTRYVGWLPGLAVFLALPAIGALGLWVRERWQGAYGDVRRFIFLRSRSRLVSRLRSEQARLAAALDALIVSSPESPPPD